MMMRFTSFIIFLCLAAAEVPLYIPADLSCLDLWSHHLELGASGGGDSVVWDEAGDMCNITYRGMAVSTREGRTTVSYDTTFQVRKELLSQVLNTVLRVRERDSRQVGDPFITPYLAGVYQRLGLGYSSLLCFTRSTLLWRRISAARANAAANSNAAAAAVASATTACPDHDGDDDAAAGLESRGWVSTRLRPEPSREDSAAEFASRVEAKEAGPGGPSRIAARVVSLEWHVQQLHRELVLEPWMTANLRLMLSRAAAYAETRAGGCASSTGSSSASSGLSSVSGRDAACAGLKAGPFDAAVFWLLWLVCPTLLVALETMQAAPDNPWMALYICIIATCRTLAEWRATISVACAPGFTWPQRLNGFAVAHLVSGGASAVLTGLLNTWLPLLGHSAAATVVWLHLLLLPAMMVAVMYVVGMPRVTCQLAGGGSTNGGGPGVASHRSSARDRRHTSGGVDAGGAGALGAMDSQGLGALGRRVAHDAADRGVHGGGSGRTGKSSAAAAAAQVHWPPALEVPAWLDDWPNAPEAFRCPITQSLMREPAQASSGVTYERPAIMQWLEHRRVDPVTHVPLKRHRLAPNLNLRHMIEVWVEDRVEARRRLAQRLREEVVAEAATLAAMEAAEAQAAATASSSEGEVVETSELESAPAAETSQQDAATAAAGDTTAGDANGVAANEDDAVAPASAVITAAAAVESFPAATNGMEVEEAVNQASDCEPAWQHAHGYLQPSAVTSFVASAGTRHPDNGNAGSAVSPSGATETVGPGHLGGESSAALQVEEVEALALAAARARSSSCRQCYTRGVGTEGCSAAGAPGGFMDTVSRRRYGDGDGDADLRRRSFSFRAGSVKGDTAGASSAGSRDSPFATLLARDGSVADAETELGTDVPGTDGSGVGSFMYGSSLPVERSDQQPNAEPYSGSSSANGRRRRLRGRRGSVGAAVAAAAAAAGATAATEDGGFSSRRRRHLFYEPSWAMDWDGVYPESSGLLAVDGSGTNTLLAGTSGSAAASPAFTG